MRSSIMSETVTCRPMKRVSALSVACKSAVVPLHTIFVAGPRNDLIFLADDAIVVPMSTNRDDQIDDPVQEERIDKLKEKARQAAGGQMTAWESDALSADAREQFWQRVMDFESAPLMTDFQRLTEAGLELPQPDAMKDDELTAKLWEVIHGLARIRVFLNETDHLSDRQLYDVLWRRVLREENPVIPDDPGAWHVDLLSTGDEADTYLYMKYYADESDKQHWLADFPDYVMPAHEEPPFDRDSRLPQAYDEVSSDDEDERPI